MGSDKADNLPITLVLKVVMVFALSAVVFLMVYQFDNKYTAAGPQAKGGALILDEDTLTQYPILFLVEGWEYYNGQLLTPEDFEDTPPLPDQYMFIGQFGGFEAWNGGSPHGSASYRLNIEIPEETKSYLLELPEIFSAYHLYINGRLVMKMGEPTKAGYQAETGNRSVSIEAADHIELLFAVTDYSHLYSGMVYPPAFGEVDAVSDLLSARLVFRSLLCAVALTVGLLSVMVGLLSRRTSLTAMFGLLCLFFVGYVSYPITRTLVNGGRLLYVVESISFCAMLSLTMLIAVEVSGLPKKWGLPFVSVGGLMCVAAVLLHLLLPFGNLNLILAYSWLISAYEWMAAVFILMAIWFAIRKEVAHITPLLYGVVIFVCALLADRMLPLYEPIYTGWFIELASFALVLCIGTVAGQEVATRYREGAIMAERAGSMERLYQSQISHFDMLKKEMEQTKAMRHDLRHHLLLMEEYISNNQYDKLGKYMKEYRSASVVGELQEYSPIDVINTLTHHYHGLAQQSGIRLDVRCDLKAAKDPCYTEMSDADLCCLYANLMENAVEACRRMQEGDKFIRVAVFRTASNTLYIRVWNSAEEVQARGGRFLSSKVGAPSGYGLLSVEAICKKYGGKAEFHWLSEKKEFESKVMVFA